MRSRPSHHRIARPTPGHRSPRPSRRRPVSRPLRPGGRPSGVTTSTAPTARCRRAPTGSSTPARLPGRSGTGVPARSRTTPTARTTSLSTAPATCGSRPPGRRRELDLGPGRDPAQRLQATGRRGAARSRAGSRCRTSPATRPSGYWPAFWALGAPYRGNYWNWPGIGEFDIMENVNGINSVWGVLHCGVNPGGPCNETNGIGASRACPGSTCQSAFHTYRFEWDTACRRTSCAGTSTDSSSTRSARANAGRHVDQHDSHAGYFILLNVAIGGAFPGCAQRADTPTAATVPGRPMSWTTSRCPRRGGGTHPAPDYSGHAAGGGGSAYSTIQAESFQQQSGTGVETPPTPAAART